MKKAVKVVAIIIVAKIVQEWKFMGMALEGLAMETMTIDKGVKWTKNGHRIPRNKMELNDRKDLLRHFLKVVMHGFENYRHPENIGK